VVEEKFYKQLDTIIIIYIISQIFEICRSVGCMDVPLKMYSPLAFSIAYITCHLQGIKQTPRLRWVFKLLQFQIHPPLNILTVPDWLL
jgi:hypothetical protein